MSLRCELSRCLPAQPAARTPNNKIYSNSPLAATSNAQLRKSFWPCRLISRHVCCCCRRRRRLIAIVIHARANFHGKWPVIGAHCPPEASPLCPLFASGRRGTSKSPFSKLNQIMEILVTQSPNILFS
jgi:hypothetical protein